MKFVEILLKMEMILVMLRSQSLPTGICSEGDKTTSCNIADFVDDQNLLSRLPLTLVVPFGFLINFSNLLSICFLGDLLDLSGFKEDLKVALS